MPVIFDLDQTLVDSSIAEAKRNSRQWQQVYRLIPQFTLYDGIQEFLDKCVERETEIAVVTSSPRSYCERVLNHFNLNFTNIVCYHDTKRRKPHPDPIEFAISRFKDKNKSILSLGDRVIDIQATKAAKRTTQLNIIAGACLWGSNEIEGLKNSKPDTVFKTPQDLMKIF